MINTITQRFVDWKLERRIQGLSRECLAQLEAGDKTSARLLDVLRMEAIRQRSPGQVSRMEQRMGLSPRRSLKGGAMAAFCCGWLPAAVVTFLFRVFRLRGL